MVYKLVVSIGTVLASVNYGCYFGTLTNIVIDFLAAYDSVQSRDAQFQDVPMLDPIFVF
jgi:hypothetical protein